jgi:hypothetical protein
LKSGHARQRWRRCAVDRRPCAEARSLPQAARASRAWCGVVQIEVAAARRGKDQGRARICWCSLEGGERDRLERNGPDAPLRLGALEPTLGEGPTDVGDPLVEVNVAAFERDPLARSKAGSGREDHHRPVTRAKPGRDRFEFGPRLERPFLGAPPLRVIDPPLRWIDVNHPPDDCAPEHLAERLCRSEAMAWRGSSSARQRSPADEARSAATRRKLQSPSRAASAASRSSPAAQRAARDTPRPTPRALMNAIPVARAAAARVHARAPPPHSARRRTPPRWTRFEPRPPAR